MTLATGMSTALWAAVVIIAGLTLLVAAWPRIRDRMLEDATVYLQTFRELAQDEQQYLNRLRADWDEHRASDECRGDDCDKCPLWRTLVEGSEDDLDGLRRTVREVQSLRDDLLHWG